MLRGTHYINMRFIRSIVPILTNRYEENLSFLKDIGFDNIYQINISAARSNSESAQYEQYFLIKNKPTFLNY